MGLRIRGCAFRCRSRCRQGKQQRSAPYDSKPGCAPRQGWGRGGHQWARKALFLPRAPPAPLELEHLRFSMLVAPLHEKDPLRSDRLALPALGAPQR